MTDTGWTGQRGQHNQVGRGWAVGLRFGDRYEVERLIGEGGWAETYRGQDLLLGRTVAIKLLRTQFAAEPALVDRFEREARIAAAISHPNVVTVYDYGTQDGAFFIALQFIAGEDLKQRIIRRGRLAAAEAIGVTREILLGLGAIHRAGIVHRDVKPQNVLIGDDGIVRITDFGIAHQSLATRVTTHGDAMGTASYMAPEQAQGEDVTPATDIYALGVVLYELLTGRLPFNRGHAMAILLAHLQDVPEPPGRVAPDAVIPGWLEAIVLRAMAKSPSDRYASAAEMLQALAAAGHRISPTEATERLVGSTETSREATSAMSGGSMATTVARQDIGAVPRPRPAGGPGGIFRQPPPPTNAERGPSRWGRTIAIVLFALIAFAIAGVGAANLLDRNGDNSNVGGSGGDATATATVRSISPISTATEEPDDGDAVTVQARPSATRRAEPDPTERPRPTAEAVSTDSPIETPTEVPTEPATEVPTVPPTPTEVPTVPPTPTDVPVTPTDTPVSENDGPPIESVTELAASGAAGGMSEPIVILADSWSGGAGKKNDDELRGNGNGNGSSGDDVASVEARSGAKSTAELEFSLAAIPAAGVRIEIQTRIERPEDGPALLAFAVNDAATASPIDLSESGDSWAIVDIRVPAEVLVAGTNRIVVTAEEADDSRGRAVVILLGTVTVTQVGGVTSETGAAGSESDIDRDDTPEPVVEEAEDAGQGTEANSGEPTIAPVNDY